MREGMWLLTSAVARNRGILNMRINVNGNIKLSAARVGLYLLPPSIAVIAVAAVSPDRLLSYLLGLAMVFNAVWWAYLWRQDRERTSAVTQGGSTGEKVR